MVLAAVLALFIIPAVVIPGLIVRWRLRHMMAGAYRLYEIIDVEYRIIDRERQEG
jgi:hypothetical protein